MPKKGVTYVVEVVYLVAVISVLQSLLLGSFDNLSWKDSALEVDSVGDIDFAVVDKIMSSLEVLDGLLK